MQSNALDPIEQVIFLYQHASIEMLLFDARQATQMQSQLQLPDQALQDMFNTLLSTQCQTVHVWSSNQYTIGTQSHCYFINMQSHSKI